MSFAREMRTPLCPRNCCQSVCVIGMKFSMAKLPTIEGALTALVTPFRDGKIDFDGLAKLVDWQIENGIDGIVSVGTTGESATLDVDEHVAVIAATVKAARGRVP